MIRPNTATGFNPALYAAQRNKKTSEIPEKKAPNKMQINMSNDFVNQSASEISMIIARSERRTEQKVIEGNTLKFTSDDIAQDDVILESINDDKFRDLINQYKMKLEEKSEDSISQDISESLLDNESEDVLNDKNEETLRKMQETQELDDEYCHENDSEEIKEEAKDYYSEENDKPNESDNGEAERFCQEESYSNYDIVRQEQEDSHEELEIGQAQFHKAINLHNKKEGNEIATKMEQNLEIEKEEQLKDYDEMPIDEEKLQVDFIDESYKLTFNPQDLKEKQKYPSIYEDAVELNKKELSTPNILKKSLANTLKESCYEEDSDEKLEVTFKPVAKNELYQSLSKQMKDLPAADPMRRVFANKISELKKELEKEEQDKKVASMRRQKLLLERIGELNNDSLMNQTTTSNVKKVLKDKRLSQNEVNKTKENMYAEVLTFETELDPNKQIEKEKRLRELRLKKKKEAEERQRDRSVNKISSVQNMTVTSNNNSFFTDLNVTKTRIVSRGDDRVPIRLSREKSNLANKKLKANQKDYAKKSNKAAIKKAIQYVCLAGEPNKQSREILLSILDRCTAENYILLFKTAGGQNIKALYTFDPKDSTIQLLSSFTASPILISQEKIKEFYKFEVAQKQFKVLKGVKEVSLIVDAIALKGNL